MVVIKPSVAPWAQGKRHGGGKPTLRKGGHGAKGGGGHGAKGGGWGGGKGAAKGGGQWMFIPAAQVAQASPYMAPQRSFGKGGQKFGGKSGGKGGQRFGKGAPIVSFGKGGGFHAVPAFGGKGKGGGKHASQNPQQKKSLDKLGKIDADHKVWIGGLPKDVNRGKLHAHFKDTVKPHIFELMSKGTACIAFKTAEDAQSAIDTFNGSELEGKEIQVDVWTQKEKKERQERTEGEKPQQKKSVIKTSFLKTKLKGKGKGKGKEDSKMKIKIKGVESTLKVWVGGLSETTTWKQLKQHFVDSGCEVDMCDLMKPGTACCTFKTEEEVTSAIGIMNGTELDDKTVEVDAWTRPERKEKVKKEKA